MKQSITIMAVCLMLGLALPAQGFWWLFGRARGEVELQFLQINNVRFDEAGGSVGFTRELLDNGRLVIRGRARAGGGQIGAVEVSIDNQATWQQANMAADGTFEFSWAPQLGVTYVVFVKAITTTGQSNKVEDTRLEVRLLEQDLRSLVVEALNRLIQAYQEKNPNDFMANVSQEFAGDTVVLDRAIRNDFSLFDKINLSFVLNNLAIGRNGRIIVGITFQRSLVASRSGQQFSDRGQTEFTFAQEAAQAKVWAMKAPLIFGLSDAEQVSTGTVGQPANQQVILVDDRGNVQTADATQVLNQADGRAGSESGDFLLENEQGWNFADGMTTNNFNRADIMAGLWGDNGQTGGMLMFAQQHGGGRDLGPGTIAGVTEAPAAGYDQPEAHLEGAIGRLYALRTIDGKYAVIEIVSVAGGRVRIRYKYQPNGTRFF